MNRMVFAAALLLAVAVVPLAQAQQSRPDQNAHVAVDAPPTAVAPTSSASLDAIEISATIKRVADWQLAHQAAYTAGDWTMAPLYDGLIDASLATGEPRYLAAVVREGRSIGFAPGHDLGNADSHAAGRAWLRIHQMNSGTDPELLVGFQEHFQDILARRDRGLGWSWADALYMAPPTLVQLAKATGDERYLDLAYSEFAATRAALFDAIPNNPRENLYYRDARFLDQRSARGEKVFWSRGNGWVYAGLAAALDSLPSDHPSRQFYLGAFSEMSPAIAQAQQSDGLWYPSLLDPQHVPIGETSGSALLLFGLAWGVEHGVLDRETYLPTIERGWRGLLTRITAEGKVEFVQPIGAEPKSFDPHNSEPYGTGAVLQAGSELLRLLHADAAADAFTLRNQAEQIVKDAPPLSSKAR